MKFKLVLVVVLLAIGGVALAQPYNIALAPRLVCEVAQGPIAAAWKRVAPGTILQVVGKFNRWLKISRSGSELWMADWVNYTRVGTSAAPVESSPAILDEQPQAEVDNYCFTIRTCQSQDDWVRGYNDYQRDAADGRGFVSDCGK